MRDDKMQYDLNYIIKEMTPEWVAKEPELFIELARWMYEELTRRKRVIKVLQNIINDTL